MKRLFLTGWSHAQAVTPIFNRGQRASCSRGSQSTAEITPPLWAAIESVERKMGCVPQPLSEQQDPIVRL
jgi:hypothetical protein